MQSAALTRAMTGEALVNCYDFRSLSPKNGLACKLI